MSLLSVIVVCLLAAPLAWMAARDHRARRTARRELLSDCTRLFDSYTLEHGGDGFPRVIGRQGRRQFDIRLISDGMTIRRLPQLWLQVTELADLDGVSGMAVLVRPSGYEFFSLTSGFHSTLETPGHFPPEAIVRGESERSARTLAALAQPMGEILRDPGVKEIAVTAKGLRIIRQADEGRRGDYLLLRQAAFDERALPAAMIAGVLGGLETLAAPIAASRQDRVRA